MAIMTAAVVPLVGVEDGIVLAMVVSLLRVVQHSYRPHSGVLVADGKGAWSLTPAEPNAVTEPGLVLYRFGAALFYANVGQFFEEISRIVQPMPSTVRWVIVDAEAMTHVDYTAAKVVLELNRNLVHAGIVLGFARVPWDSRADFDRHHITESIGAEHIFDRLHDAIAAYEALPKSSTENPGPTG